MRLLLILSFLFGTLSIAHADTHNNSVVNEIVDRGALRVGFSSFVPWAMRSKDGEFIGFEIDVAKEVAKDMGVELELIPTAWDGIIPALLANKFDIIISGMYVTPARNLQVNFSIPYDENGLDIVANRTLAAGFDNIDAFNNSEITFALRRGSYPVSYTKERLPEANIVQFDDDATARLEVINGRAHAWITAAPQPQFAVIDYPDVLFRPVDHLLTINKQGMALRKGDADALNFFDNWIRVKQQSGWLQERHNYWFGGRDWAAQAAQ